jgi:hypothetical protein
MWNWGTGPKLETVPLQVEELAPVLRDQPSAGAEMK